MTPDILAQAGHLDSAAALLRAVADRNGQPDAREVLALLAHARAYGRWVQALHDAALADLEADTGDDDPPT